MFRPLQPGEQMLGTALGPGAAPPLPRSTFGARAALEAVVEPAVTAGRLHVMFSGGRDSSLVLAVATHVARRLGADDPVPVTAVYPGTAGTDESDFQDLVLAHLGLRRRVVVPVHGERSHLGELALTGLLRHGPVWPTAVQTQPVFFEPAGPGSTMLTGEAGDGIVEAHRTAALLALGSAVRARRRPSRTLVRESARAVEPQVVARRRDARAWSDRTRLAWLREPARRELVRRAGRERLPLRWDHAVWHLLHLRVIQLGLHNTVVGASEHGVSLVHPLGSPAFVAAFAHEVGARGFVDRTAAMRYLGADLLPDAILARTTKAYFNASRFTDVEAAFAREWDGRGVDPELIDVEALRAEWLSARPHPLSAYLLHLAWYAQHGQDAGHPMAQDAPATRPTVGGDGSCSSGRTD